jgi:hypothetical protein
MIDTLLTSMTQSIPKEQTKIFDLLRKTTFDPAQILRITERRVFPQKKEMNLLISGHLDQFDLYLNYSAFLISSLTQLSCSTLSDVRLR